MANPQAENGHTDIAHDYLEALMRAHLTGVQYQIMLAVIRKTWGWHKKADNISLAQIAKMVDLLGPKKDTHVVMRAVHALQERRLLVVTKQSPPGSKLSLPNRIALQKDFDKWVVTKRSPLKGGDQAVPTVGTKQSPGMGTKQSPTKEKKETLTKENKYIALFDEKFWPIYPNKEAKKEALKEWLKLKPSDSLVEAIITHIQKAKKTKKWEAGYSPNPKNYLAGERWNDEISNNGHKKDDEFLQHIKAFANAVDKERSE